MDAHVVNEDPLHWESDEKFERIVCSPPFGSHDGEFKAIERALSLLDKNGLVAAIVSPNFLWGSRQSRMREMISESARPRAIVSLPPNVFAHTSIRSAILVLQEEAAGKTYMASSKSVADLGAIAEDYAAWRRGQRFSLGFEVDLDSSRWDVAYHEPIDFGLGGITFPYKVVPLGEVAQIDAGKRSDAARIAINRTGSKVVWLEDAPDDLIVKNNIFVAPQGIVNPLYIHFYLSSSLGKRALAKRVTGATIPHISPKDLAGLPVVVPELRQQGKIVEQALKIRQITAALEALAFEGQQSLSDRFFNLEAVSDKFLKFSENTEKAFYQRLPFPIAVVYRKIANAANNTQRYSLLIELFEVVIRFIVLVNLADYLNSRKAAETLVQQVPDIRKLSAPSLGHWVVWFRSLSHIKTAAQSRPFLREIKEFKLHDYQRMLDEFVNIRNESLRGHGATLSEGEYELKFQEHSPKLNKLIGDLGFLANYRLVKTGSMDKDGDFYKISVQNLMGDNPHFESDHVVLRTPLETNKVLYLNAEAESLVLDPYIILELCPECRRPEVLLFDKFSEQKITYLGYESGHKPSFPNVDRLPLVIREAATRRH